MPKRTGRPWRRIRDAVIRRDGGICHLCGQPGADTADHLVPHSHGGTDHPGNLRAAHVSCNRMRGARPIAKARAELARTNPDATPGWRW